MTAPERCTVPAGEVEFTAIRAQGPGGQHVNKVASAVQLRFDIRASALPDPVKARLLALRDQRILAGGVVVIKAQTHRSQAQNRSEALDRLQALVDRVAAPLKSRKATQPTRGAQRRRLEGKAVRGALKRLRAPLTGGE